MSQPLENLPPVLTVSEAAAILRLGRDACYDAIRRGEIPSVKFGRRIVVPLHALQRLLNGELRQNPDKEPALPPPIMSMKQAAVSNLRKGVRLSRMRPID